jgi:hypothetical protein
MPKTATPDIDSIVSEFVEKLSATIRANTLNDVMATLGGSAAPVRRGPGRPKGSGVKSGGKRTPEQLEALSEKLLAHVKSNPGKRAEQIAAAVGSDVDSIRPTMKKLIASKKVKTKGQRRGMYYFPTGRG